MIYTLLVTFFFSVLAGASAQSAPGYKYFRSGSSSDISTSVQPGFMLSGGNDTDAAFQWLCAKSGGGDFVVLRATGKDDYNPYIQKLCKVNSVSTLVIPTREAANAPQVAEAIRKAEAIFIAGGDQANYVNFWKGTPVQQEVNAAIARGVPVGGNSAGLAVMGEYVFAALNDTAYSKIVLKNPYDKTVTIVRDFLDVPVLKGIITDTHFAKRDRLGRLLTFMARIQQDGWAQRVRAIAVDERSAIVLEPDGAATVVGKSASYFLESNEGPAQCREGMPLTYRNIAVQKVLPGGKFNVRDWTGAGAIRYTVSVEGGKVSSTQGNGAVY